MDATIPPTNLMVKRGHTFDRNAISKVLWINSKKDRFFSLAEPASEVCRVLLALGRYIKERTTETRLPNTAIFALRYKSPIDARYPPNAGPTVAPCDKNANIVSGVSSQQILFFQYP